MSGVRVTTWIRSIVLVIMTMSGAVSCRAEGAGKITAPVTTVRLAGVNCFLTCWLSGLFAPAVIRDRIAAVPLTNATTHKASVTVHFVPTNGLALSRGKVDYLSLSDRPEGLTPPEGKAAPLPSFDLRAGETKQYGLSLTGWNLPAGLYTGQHAIEAKAGEEKANRLADPPKSDSLSTLESLKVRLDSRGVDPQALQAEVKHLEDTVNAAFLPQGQNQQAMGVPGGAAAPSKSNFKTIASPVGNVLRVIAGVSALRIRSVYDWLMPIFTVLTLVALTVVFMLQQYGGGGAAETFGAGGLADYAAPSSPAWLPRRSWEAFVQSSSPDLTRSPHRTSSGAASLPACPPEEGGAASRCIATTWGPR